jgi:hypothetical protein
MVGRISREVPGVPRHSLHAWAWERNPRGPLSMWNPRVSCPAKAVAPVQ